jgi:hypothetical protein
MKIRETETEIEFHYYSLSLSLSDKLHYKKRIITTNPFEKKTLKIKESLHNLNTIEFKLFDDKVFSAKLNALFSNGGEGGGGGGESN